MAGVADVEKRSERREEDRLECYSNCPEFGEQATRLMSSDELMRRATLSIVELAVDCPWLPTTFARCYV
jgi:hypothetical protein